MRLTCLHYGITDNEQEPIDRTQWSISKRATFKLISRDCTVDLLLFYRRYDSDMSDTTNREASKSSDTPNRRGPVNHTAVNHFDRRDSDRKSLFSALKQKVRM